MASPSSLDEETLADDIYPAEDHLPRMVAGAHARRVAVRAAKAAQAAQAAEAALMREVMEAEAWCVGGGISSGLNAQNIGWTDTATLGHVYGETRRIRTASIIPAMPNFHFQASFVRRSPPPNEFVAPGLKPGASRRHDALNAAEAHEIRMHRQLACERYLESCRSHSVPSLRPWVPPMTPPRTPPSSRLAPMESGSRRSPTTGRSPAGCSPAGRSPADSRFGDGAPGGGAPLFAAWPPERLRRTSYSTDDLRGFAAAAELRSSSPMGLRAPGSSGSPRGARAQQPGARQQLPPLSHLTEQQRQQTERRDLGVRLNAWASPPKKYFVIPW